jgi:hypothetical protein
MAAQIHGHQPMVFGQIGVHLPAPHKTTLGKSVEEQNGATTRVSRLNDVKLCASAASHLVSFHPELLSLPPPILLRGIREDPVDSWSVRAAMGLDDQEFYPRLPVV